MALSQNITNHQAPLEKIATQEQGPENQKDIQIKFNSAKSQEPKD